MRKVLKRRNSVIFSDGTIEEETNDIIVRDSARVIEIRYYDNDNTRLHGVKLDGKYVPELNQHRVIKLDRRCVPFIKTEERTVYSEGFDRPDEKAEVITIGEFIDVIDGKIRIDPLMRIRKYEKALREIQSLTRSGGPRSRVMVEEIIVEVLAK